MYHGTTHSTDSIEGTLDAIVDDLPALPAGERTVLVALAAGKRHVAESLIVEASSSLARFQLRGDWRPLDRDPAGNRETMPRADLRNLRDGLSQEATIVRLSASALHVQTRRPADGAVELIVHEGRDGVRIPCEVVRSSLSGQTTDIVMRFRDLTPDQVDFVRRMMETFESVSEPGRAALAS